LCLPASWPRNFDQSFGAIISSTLFGFLLGIAVFHYLVFYVLPLFHI
jgi:Na+/citrate or Na+/malate symporter